MSQIRGVPAWEPGEGVSIDQAAFEITEKFKQRSHSENEGWGYLIYEGQAILVTKGSTPGDILAQFCAESQVEAEAFAEELNEVAGEDATTVVEDIITDGCQEEDPGLVVDPRSPSTDDSYEPVNEITSENPHQWIVAIEPNYTDDVDMMYFATESEAQDYATREEGSIANRGGYITVGQIVRRITVSPPVADVLEP